MNIEELIKEYPNDMELGAKIREIYFKNKKVFEEMEGKFIYESPDGGKTVYQRPFGGNINERTLVK